MNKLTHMEQEGLDNGLDQRDKVRKDLVMLNHNWEMASHSVPKLPVFLAPIRKEPKYFTETVETSLWVLLTIFQALLGLGNYLYNVKSPNLWIWNVIASLCFTFCVYQRWVLFHKKETG